MQIKTQGIVVSYIKFKETSIIVKIFTRELGYKSYIINSVRSAKARSKMALFQPLTLLDMIVYEKANAGINRISENKLAIAFQRIPFDFHRSSIAMFMADVMNKSIYDNYENEGLFDFLWEAIQLLDSKEAILSHFPLAMLWEASRYLGFAPQDADEFFQELSSELNNQIDFSEESKYLNNLIENSFHYKDKVDGKVRRALLDLMIHYYSTHLENDSEWKSIKVLRKMM